jgi:hypothetical protein
MGLNNSRFFDECRQAILCPVNDAAEIQSLALLLCLPALHQPKPARDAAEVALHDADHVHVLNAGATAVVDNSGQAKQQGRQRAAAAQQLQPLLAQMNLVLRTFTEARARRCCDSMVPRSSSRCTT